VSDSTDTVVIGAGVVGLAIARELALAGREVIVLEKNAADRRGKHRRRNSEVIHAGLYYPRGSLKARFLRRGSPATLRILRSQARAASALRQAARRDAFGPGSKARLGPRSRCGERRGQISSNYPHKMLQRLEPDVHALAGFLSPSTGIVDSHAFMLALRGDLEAAGGAIATHCQFTGAKHDGAMVHLTCETADGPFTLGARTVVNAAGLHATRVARLLGAIGRNDPTAALREGQLLHVLRPEPVHTPCIPVARGRRPRRACHPRSCRARALRSRRGMVARRRRSRLARLRRRPEPFGRVLRRHPQLLAGAPRRRPGTSVFRDSPEDFRPRWSRRRTFRFVGSAKAATRLSCSCSASSRRA